jgi:hypothetical protein
LHLLKLGVNYHFGSPVAAAFADAPAPAGPRGFNFEIGGRYWYSWGKHQYDLGLLKGEPAPSHSLISRLTYDNLQTNAGEIYARLDAPYQVFVKGFVGTGTTGEGKMSDEDFNIGTPPDQLQYTRTRHWVEGEVPAYATVDLGYDWWRAAPYRIGTFVGYSYFHRPWTRGDAFRPSIPSVHARARLRNQQFPQPDMPLSPRARCGRRCASARVVTSIFCRA